MGLGVLEDYKLAHVPGKPLPPTVPKQLDALDGHAG